LRTFSITISKNKVSRRFGIWNLIGSDLEQGFSRLV
jgi:hypothetical protein